MISCYVSRSESRRPQIFCSITGHAYYAPKGQDIVCAGVSALYQSLELGLSNYEPEFQDASGGGCEAFYVFNPSEIGNAFVDNFVESMKLLESQYPECIEINVL